MTRQLFFYLTLSLLSASCANDSAITGLWQLQQIATNDTTLYEDRVYYSFDLGVLFLQNNARGRSCYGRYTLSDNRLTMEAITDTSIYNLMRCYHWGNTLERCFEVRELSSRTLILATHDTCYTFYKF